MSTNDGTARSLAKNLILVEKKSFYGSESERDRLRKMREIIEQAVKVVDPVGQEESNDS